MCYALWLPARVTYIAEQWADVLTYTKGEMALPPLAETQEHKLDESDDSRQGFSLRGQ